MNHQELPIDRSDAKIHRRPVWIILFAAILILTAGVSCGQQPASDQAATTTAEYDGIYHNLPKASIDARAGRAAVAARHRRIQQLRGRRPKYAMVKASLANFDADWVPDGWIAEVMLFDASDRAVIKRANASFELMPRMPSADYVGYVNAKVSPLRWSLPLNFDDEGVARVKLPLREKLDPVFDRHATILPDPGLGTSVLGSRHVVLRRSLDRSRSAFSRDWRSNVGRPESGQLKVRVSVPTAGVFQAATAVPMRPPVLVDTNWPYR